MFQAGICGRPTRETGSVHSEGQLFSTKLADQSVGIRATVLVHLRGPPDQLAQLVQRGLQGRLDLPVPLDLLDTRRLREVGHQ